VLQVDVLLTYLLTYLTQVETSMRSVKHNAVVSLLSPNLVEENENHNNGTISTDPRVSRCMVWGWENMGKSIFKDFRPTTDDNYRIVDELLHLRCNQPLIAEIHITLM